MNRHSSAGAALQRLSETMHRLRAPRGCAWDAKQTLSSLRPYLLEETYEVLDALDATPGGDAHRDELGDLLLQIVFQAEVAQEASNGFDFTAVADAIREKLIRRHPHVFGDATADTADGALANWEEAKAKERGKKGSRLDGVPQAMPALLRAQRTGEKAAATGFDWPNLDGALAKSREEWAEFQATLDDNESKARVAEELGDHLFALASVARHLEVDLEACMREAVDKFTGRFKAMEKFAAETGGALTDLDLEAQEALWQRAKREA